MKRIILAMAITVVTCLLAACGSGSDTVPEATPAPTPIVTPSPSPEPETSPEPVALSTERHTFSTMNFILPNEWDNFTEGETAFTIRVDGISGAADAVVSILAPIVTSTDVEDLLNSELRHTFEETTTELFSAEGVNVDIMDDERLAYPILLMASPSYLLNGECGAGASLLVVGDDKVVTIHSFVRDGADADGIMRTLGAFATTIRFDYELTAQLPIPIPEPEPLTNFFAIEDNVEQFDQFMRSGNFVGIRDLANAYIEHNNPDEQDSVWAVLNYLEPLLENIDRVTIVHDTFNNVATIFYSGLTDINLTHSFVPYTGTRSRLGIMVGFHNNGWIFADRARIRLENGETVSVIMGRDATTDVIRGGEIREFVRLNPSSRQLEQLLASRPYIIRFEGNERQLDRTLTEAEQNALEIIHLFDRSQIPLRHLFNRRGE